MLFRSYIDKNTVPTYVIYKGEGGRVSKVEEKPDDSRRVIVVEKGGFMNAVQWEGAKDAVEWQYRTIEEQFYQQTQVFNNSPSAMQKTPLSADNKEILLFDSKARAKDGKECGSDNWRYIHAGYEWAEFKRDDF